MNTYYYDLHIHSCLSPCADNDNTPHSLAGMALLAGLQIVALTDHNTTRNCPAFFEAAQAMGLIPVAGMELTTAEDIHVVCLFPTLEDAMAFGDEIDTRRVKIPNRTDIFGDQLVTDAADTVIAEEPYLLSNATTVPLEECDGLAAHFGGVCYPAHIDRDANGIIAVLGSMPPDPPFTCVELHDIDREAAMREAHDLTRCRVVTGSDAHYLWDIRDAHAALTLAAPPEDPAAVRRELIEWIRRGV